MNKWSATIVAIILSATPTSQVYADDTGCVDANLFWGKTENNQVTGAVEINGKLIAKIMVTRKTEKLSWFFLGMHGGNDCGTFAYQNELLSLTCSLNQNYNLVVTRLGGDSNQEATVSVCSR